MGTVTRSGRPQYLPQVWTGSPVGIGFFPKLSVAGTKFSVPGWENQSFDSHTLTANQLIYIPCLVSEPSTYTGIFVRVTSFAAGNLRMGIYRYRAGQPGALVLDAGVVSTGSNGVKEIVISQFLEPSYYFLAYVCDATPDLRCMKRLDPFNIPVSCFANNQNFAHRRDVLAVAGQGGQVATGLLAPTITADDVEGADAVCVSLREP